MRFTSITVCTLISGTNYHKTANQNVEDGTAVNIRTDPNNPRDPFALRVQARNGRMLGHVKKEMCPLMTEAFADPTIIVSAKIGYWFDHDDGFGKWKWELSRAHRILIKIRVDRTRYAALDAQGKRNVDA